MVVISKYSLFRPICLIWEIFRIVVVSRKNFILTSKIIQFSRLIPYMKLHTYGSRGEISLKTVFMWKTMKIAV